MVRISALVATLLLTFAPLLVQDTAAQSRRAAAVPRSAAARPSAPAPAASRPQQRASQGRTAVSRAQARPSRPAPAASRPQQSRTPLRPAASSNAGQAQRRAQPRQGTTIRSTQGQRPAPQGRAAAPTQRPNPQSQRRAVPRASRPQGDNPQTGTAVRRGSPRAGSVPQVRTAPRGQTRTTVRRAPRIYTNNYYSYPRSSYYYYYYPRSAYPYGYGAFGLGYFYYDPYSWGPRYSGGVYYRNGGGGVGYYDIGNLRLQVAPRDAEVWVDGYYVGVVDEFDGRFQSLRLESGPYRIDIVAPGYEPLVVDVRITPGRTTTYRGELLPLP